MLPTELGIVWQLLTLGVVTQTYTVWLALAGHARPPMRRDSALLELTGRVVATGGQPYLDVWDVKPPLALELPAVLAVVTTDPLWLHLLHVGVMAGAAIGSIVVVGTLTARVTNDAAAGLVGGVGMLLLPGYLVRPALGYKPKYLVLCAGLLALWLAVRGRWATSGLAAGAATGFWQLGIVYPVVVSLLAWDREGRRGAARAAGGVAVAAVGMTLPVVLVGAGEAMLVQAVAVPVLSPEGFSLPRRLYWGVRRFKYAAPFVLLGVFGLASFARRRPRVVRRQWWVVACTAWFGLVALAIDFDIWGYTDLIPGLPFVAIGVGALYATLDRDQRRTTLVAGLAAVVTINVLLHGAVGVVFQPATAQEPADLTGETTFEGKLVRFSPPPFESAPDTRTLYWSGERPETCHVRFSLLELRWIERVGRYPVCDAGLDDVRRVARVGDRSTGLILL